MTVCGRLAGAWVCTLLLGFAGCGAEGSDKGPRVALLRVADGRVDLITVGATGRDVEVLVGDSVESGVRPHFFERPSWSPDGGRLTFTAQLDDRGFERDIYVLRSDGSDLERITNGRASSGPVWSPDGRVVVFTRFSYDRRFGIRLPVGGSVWAMDADGSNQRRLTPEDKGIFDLPGSFSPDGRKLAFTRSVGETLPLSPNRADVYVLRPDRSIEKLGERAAAPAYSPDGRRIVFASERDGNGRLCYGDRCFYAAELYVMDADGSDKERLTNTHGLNEAAPTWSPDGARIAYQRGRVTGNAEATGVYGINPDGSCPTRIAVDPRLIVWHWAPAWQPGSGPGRLDC